MRRLSATAVVALVLALFAAPVASGLEAGPVLRVSFCQPSGTLTFCSTVFIVTQERTSQGGVTTYQLRERTSLTVTDEAGDVVLQESGTDHIQTVTTQGNEVVSLRTASHTISVGDETCTDFFRYHLTNGVLQYDESGFSCA